MSSKCDIIGHNFNIVDEDAGRTHEECEECGFRKTFFKQQVTGTKSEESKEYMDGHKRHFIQPTQTKEWEMAGYKKKAEDQEMKEHDERLKEAYKETEKAERKAHSERVSKVVWK